MNKEVVNKWNNANCAMVGKNKNITLRIIKPKGVQMGSYVKKETKTAPTITKMEKIKIQIEGFNSYNIVSRLKNQ